MLPRECWYSWQTNPESIFMTTELVIVLILLAAAISMFVVNRPRMDAVALLMLTALPFTGAITMSEALAGFSDASIVLIGALFVIGDGLVRTGVARWLGDWLTNRAGGNQVKLLALLMVVVCGLGSMMSSTAVTAIFIPVALRIAHSTGTSPSRLMMPLSMAALISGMTTLVATAPNLVVNAELIRQGADGFRFFSFAPFGVPILILGILYMTFARRWLTDSTAGQARGPIRPSLREWIDEYKLAGREYRVRVAKGSPLRGRTIKEAGPQIAAEASIVAIERNHVLIQPTAKTKLEVGDVLLVDLAVPATEAAEIHNRFALDEMPLSGSYFTDHSQEIGMAEVIVPDSSELVGRTVIESHFRDRFGLTVIGVRHGAAAVESKIREQKLRIGDTLLVIGPWRALRNVQHVGGQFVLLNLPAELDEVLPVAGRAPHAIACLALVVGLMITGVVPNVQAALIGCLLMGLLGVTDLVSAYRSIDWKTIVLIVGMLPFSLALQRTGGVNLAADGLMSVVGGAGTHVVLGTIFIMTATIGLFISNTATAVLMAPVALAIAHELKASPYPFAMIVALAASTAFMTPVSSPVNTLVVSPGNYTFGDFIKVGVPFSLVVMVVCVLLVPWLLPL
jgi:di/tricarboxylate transporter